MGISQKVTFYRSLAFKNAIIYLLIFLTGLGILGYLLFDNSSRRIIQTAENQLVHSGEIVEVQLREYIEGLLSDLDFLSKNPVLLRYLKRSDSDNYELITNEFLTLIESNNNFSQIRFLNAENGLELVRVDQKDGVSEIVSKSMLQFKKDRDYFQSSIKLSSTNTYISPINLNREFGEISSPYTPTLRVARPIYLDSELKGVIVINTDLSNLFEKLQNSVGTNFSLRIVNGDGYYLLHENQDSTFQFEFGGSKQQVENALLRKGNELVRNSNELISIHRTKIKPLDYDFISHIVTNKSQLLQPYYQWRNKSILLILVIALLFSGLTFILLRRQSKNLKRLTNTMRIFPERRVVSELPVNRNDEIGDLARGFEEMSKIITDQIERIESEKLKAEKAEKEKSIFIENISHEIRNPLQSIIGLSNILEQNKLNPNQVDILKSIKLNTANLHALVNSILNYQKSINSTIKVELVWTDINELIQELITGIKYAANQKDIDLQINLDSRLESIVVKIDRLKISQILNNLITNAINHTPSEGKVNVRLDLIENDKEHAKLKFRIADNGVGMSQTELNRIKERYFTKSQDQLLYTNFGLGLTIVHELLGLLNTELTIESEKDSGSIFSFELDVLTKAKLLESAQDDGLENTFKALKILIIEDDDQVKALYDYYFMGYDVKSIKSISELDGHSEKFKIVISDFKLANSTLTDHTEVLSKISTPETSLVVVSGARPDLNILEKQFPEMIFLQKPINNKSLFEAISMGRVCLAYGRPTMENIKKDYDYDQSKYSKAIQLLLDEWEIYMNRLLKGISDNDHDEIEEILHKFNNTLRRLKLHKFEKYLVSLKEAIKSKDFDSKERSNEIRRIMNLYFNYIESSLNS